MNKGHTSKDSEDGSEDDVGELHGAIERWKVVEWSGKEARFRDIETVAASRESRGRLLIIVLSQTQNIYPLPVFAKDHLSLPEKVWQRKLFLTLTFPIPLPMTKFKVN